MGTLFAPTARTPDGFQESTGPTDFLKGPYPIPECTALSGNALGGYDERYVDSNGRCFGGIPLPNAIITTAKQEGEREHPVNGKLKAAS